VVYPKQSFDGNYCPFLEEEKNASLTGGTAMNQSGNTAKDLIAQMKWRSTLQGEMTRPNEHWVRPKEEGLIKSGKMVGGDQKKFERGSICTQRDRSPQHVTTKRKPLE